MSAQIPGLLDSAQLLVCLQRGNEIAKGFSGCLDPEEIARCVTDGLIRHFDCAFARIWLAEPEATALKLVASSGLYTRIDGSFARVPMGAYKVGKIAQNRVSFLSNNLAAEFWVKDRDWAIANRIQGFAGYPLTVDEHVVGVLAVFSHAAMAPEFLEVLQFLCTTIAIALETALHYQQEKQRWQSPASVLLHQMALSDQLASTLGSARLTLIGTERPLPLAVNYVFLQAAEIVSQMSCIYCRLLYGEKDLALDALVSDAEAPITKQQNWRRVHFGSLYLAVASLGGMLQSQNAPQGVVQVLLKVPYLRNAGQESPLSEREQEIMALLAQGHRDRDVAAHLIISESTVKFHINNILKKLKAQTRYQALHQMMASGWID